MYTCQLHGTLYIDITNYVVVYNEVCAEASFLSDRRIGMHCKGEKMLKDGLKLRSVIEKGLYCSGLVHSPIQYFFSDIVMLREMMYIQTNA